MIDYDIFYFYAVPAALKVCHMPLLAARKSRLSVVNLLQAGQGLVRILIGQDCRDMLSCMLIERC